MRISDWSSDVCSSDLKGQTREQVRFILGTPTLQDVFRTNRWDYPYYNKPGYGDEQERKFTVWFEGDSLVRWEGDQQPERQPFQKADTGISEDADTQNSDGKISSDNTPEQRSEEHTSELQSLMRISYALFCLQKQKQH